MTCAIVARAYKGEEKRWKMYPYNILKVHVMGFDVNISLGKR